MINTRQYKGYNKNNFTADLSEIFHIDLYAPSYRMSRAVIGDSQ
jgi:hypothetical protein